MKNVRVQSDAYPSTEQPASTTTRVPSGIGTSRSFACGRAPFSPNATIAAEGRPVGTRLVPRLLEPPGELGLGAPDERLLGQLAVDPVRDRARTPYRVELPGLLDRAKALDEPGRGDELDAPRP